MRAAWRSGVGEDMQRVDQPQHRRSSEPTTDDGAPTFGRASELALLERTLDAPASPLRVLCVHGPTGIGKTHLLGAWKRMCAERGANAITLVPCEAGDRDAGGGLGRALASAVAARRRADATERATSSSARTFLFLDDCDGAAADEVAIASMPSACVIVASTSRPSATGRCGRCASAHGTSLVPLRSLSREAATELVLHRGLDEQDVDAVLDHAGGHPLALLVATATQKLVLREREDAVTGAIMALVRRECPTPEQVAAIEIVAVAGALREDELGTLLGEGRTKYLFEALCSLSFALPTPTGIALHGTFRRAICADLSWRNPTRHGEIVSRVREHLLTRIRSNVGARQDAAIGEYFALEATNRACASAYAQADASAPAIVAVEAAQHPEALAMWERHEGRPAARVVRQWAERVPGSLRLCADPAGLALGALLALPVEQVRRHAHDVADSQLERLLSSLDEGGVVVRAWTTCHGHQAASTSAALLLAQIVKWQLGASPLPSTYLVAARPCAFAAAFTAIGAERLSTGEPAGASSGPDVFRFDWRFVSPTACLSALADPSGASLGPASQTARAPFDRAEFALTVQNALRWYGNDDALASTRLLATSMVSTRCKGSTNIDARVAAMRALLLEAVASLASPPKRAKYKRAVERTYIVGTLTQEQAAEQLDLPLSTYRRHLKVGLGLMVDFLWRRNVEAMGR